MEGREGKAIETEEFTQGLTFRVNPHAQYDLPRTAHRMPRRNPVRRSVPSSDGSYCVRWWDCAPIVLNGSGGSTAKDSSLRLAVAHDSISVSMALTGRP